MSSYGLLFIKKKRGVKYRMKAENQLWNILLQRFSSPIKSEEEEEKRKRLWRLPATSMKKVLASSFFFSFSLSVGFPISSALKQGSGKGKKKKKRESIAPLGKQVFTESCCFLSLVSIFVNIYISIHIYK